MSEFQKAPLFGEDATVGEQHQRSSSFKKLMSKDGKILHDGEYFTHLSFGSSNLNHELKQQHRLIFLFCIQSFCYIMNLL